MPKRHQVSRQIVGSCAGFHDNSARSAYRQKTRSSAYDSSSCAAILAVPILAVKMERVLTEINPYQFDVLHDGLQNENTLPALPARRVGVTISLNPAEAGFLHGLNQACFLALANHLDFNAAILGATFAGFVRGNRLQLALALGVNLFGSTPLETM